MNSNNRKLRRTVLCMALGLGLASLAVPAAFAGSNDGSVVGHTAAGAVITVNNTATGFTRSVTADAKGNYRFPFLPVGTYTLESSKDGAPVGHPVNVTVSLGNATTVNVGAADNATALEAISVSGTILPGVDVSSTESATNVTREQLSRIPVDQNITSVAILAPGVNRGVAGFGGISFGGSSVAENSFYVNGLNVTDFYNRNGFSSAPFAFYQEFQVKTGGYSVEFGRTTGGVINAVTRSGTNDFHFGTEMTLEPGNWHSRADDHYRADGTRYITAGKDRDSLVKLNGYVSGPIVKDKLFFFAMYEARGATPRNTNDDGTVLTSNGSDTGFWGATIDWHVNDSNLLSAMAFSDKDKNVGDVYDYDYATDTIGSKTNEIYTDTGGKNWALTWTSYLTNDLSMKLMYGRNNRESFNRGLSDLECNRVATDGDIPLPGIGLGCTTNSAVSQRNDVRKQARADFEWTLGDHLLRFGYDSEKNTSDYDRYYPGPGAIYYNVYQAAPGSSIPNPSGGVVPAGYTGYVRARRYEISGTFETTNSAYYIEDNWQVTPNLLLNLGLRRDGFDNKTGDGDSYIKMDNMIAPRLGFSWDMHGDGTTKLFGNLGRYYLPVANVINIKQAGGLLDERTYYAFDGWETRDRNGSPYAMPILGPQLGGVDVSQGDGSVGDLRSEVDHDMDQVYQDELILGFQQMLNDKWSWGVSGTYRRLHNAIDDMGITQTPCGPLLDSDGDPTTQWVMANPGSKVSIWGDTNCDGTPDGYVDIDTAKHGWAMYDSDGNYLGERGWVKPKRTYTAMEFQIDRAWDDKWAFNASYTLSWSRGNAEGPVNSDTNFDDTGRTENFDDPWVNFGGDGYLPNDRRHQIKLRGTYAITPQWQLGADLQILSGTPVTGFGSGNPYDATSYHSYYICVQNCGFIPGEVDADGDPVPYPSEQRVYERSPRGKYGRTPWSYDLGASISWQKPIGTDSRIKAKFAVYNLLNSQRTLGVNQDLQTSISDSTSDTFGEGVRFQSPRFAQLTVSVDF